MFLKIFLLSLICFSAVNYITAATDKVVCFYASWAGYRSSSASYKPENIDPTLCTHIVYAFLGVEADGSIKILDSWNEIDLGGLSKFGALKSRNPSVKLLISIGGWNAGHELLATVIASTVLRANFINSTVDFLGQWQLDGLDIAWEYPTNLDKTNYVKLLQEIRSAFDDKGYVLSITAASLPLSSYDIPQLSSLADVVNLITYDYSTPSDGFTGFNAPLYGPSSINASVSNWLDKGIHASKLTFSIPFYGHSFSLTDAAVHGVAAPASYGVAGPYTQDPGVLGYFEICAFYSDWQKVWSDNAQVPYIYSGSNWASYDDEQSVAVKINYAKATGLAGVAIWSIDTDDFLGNCGKENGLLQAIKAALAAK